MQIRAEFSDKQPEYRYMPLSNGMADVFIYKFVEEKENETDIEIKETVYIYDINEFRVSMEELTEEMVEKDPLSYLDYSPTPEDVALEERVNAIEGAIVELCEVIFNG